MNSVFVPYKKLKCLKTSLFLFLGILILPFTINAQDVSAVVDTTNIKIGEQIIYSIEVITDSTNLVTFPEGQTFAPLEVVEAYATDSSQIEDKLQLIKKYSLTKFDSGAYTIPQQRVLINEQSFLTDSVLVEVASVAVDTTKQKLYPIKPALEVPSKLKFPTWIWWVLAGLIILGLLLYLYLRRRKKKKAEANKLPPYEQAIFELKQLDSSHLLEDRQIKQYYSQLSGAVRRYLDEEIYDHAMESTSGELIQHLESKKRSGRLDLKENTINKLKSILQRADLAKFANSRPDVITAKEDRSGTESIINETKSAIPEPTEEELQRDLEYQNKLKKRKKRRKIAIGSLITVVVLGLFVTYMVSTQGFSYLSNTLFGNPTKELLEGEWIKSEYGTPPVAIATPKVLVRQIPDSSNLAKETFLSGTFFGNYYVELATMPQKKGNEEAFKMKIEEIAKDFEAMGARNIILKQEKFTTINGAEGIKVFGTFTTKNPKTGHALNREYAVLNFMGNNAFLQIKTVFAEEDSFADSITQRILNSVELKNPGN